MFSTQETSVHVLDKNRIISPLYREREEGYGGKDSGEKVSFKTRMEDPRNVIGLTTFGFDLIDLFSTFGVAWPRPMFRRLLQVTPATTNASKGELPGIAEGWLLQIPCISCPWATVESRDVCLGAIQICIARTSYGNVAGWLSVTAGIVSKRLNLS